MNVLLFCSGGRSACAGETLVLGRHSNHCLDHLSLKTILFSQAEAKKEKDEAEVQVTCPLRHGCVEQAGVGGPGLVVHTGPRGPFRRWTDVWSRPAGPQALPEGRSGLFVLFPLNFCHLLLFIL